MCRGRQACVCYFCTCLFRIVNLPIENLDAMGEVGTTYCQVYWSLHFLCGTLLNGFDISYADGMAGHLMPNLGHVDPSARARVRNMKTFMFWLAKPLKIIRCISLSCSNGSIKLRIRSFSGTGNSILVPNTQKKIHFFVI